MEFFRTAEDRFENLSDYSFAPHYIDICGLRMHYIDEGNNNSPTILMLHGEPTWSYLYRKMIPILVQAGHRVIAPDLVGFGRSDKPSKRTDYTYQRHVDWIKSLLVQLKLTNTKVIIIE